MSKKNKSKFHKRIKAQILEGISQEQQTQKPIISKQPVAPVTNPTQNLSAAPTTTTTLENEALIYTKKDLKKSAIIIGSIIILIIGLSIVDTRTNILLKASNQIFRVLNINS